jgi:superfamily II DNA or RNA helicase
MAVMPTGSGKTVLMADTVHVLDRPGVMIAHRVELVGQISLALARFGVQHDIIAPQATVSAAIQNHIAEVGRKFVFRGAPVTVAAVNTLLARAEKLKQWFPKQQWWMIDESHHCLSENLWGKSISYMPTTALGLGVTATPIRADRKSLHVDQGGVFEHMVVGPSMRELIDAGQLCDYRIFCPPEAINTADLKIGSTGDYSQPGLRQAAHKSKIVGDIVTHYKRFADGMRGITFVVDVEQAIQTAKAFVDAGVPALAVSAKTPDSARNDAIRRFRKGDIRQLVNVDLFGEGFDVPAVEVVSMGRPTMSYGLYVQQFGRALRILDGKSHGIIIDHVGNVIRHGLPDAPRQWSLMAEERGKRNSADPDAIPITRCVACMSAYERFRSVCPFCGHKPEPENRSRPEQVDGDLLELDPATLAVMRGDAERIMGDPVIPMNATPAIAGAVKKNWNARREAQNSLRDGIALWAGMWRDRGASDSEIYRRFFHRFGTDVMSAQDLGAREADDLRTRIEGDFSW